MKQHTHKLKYLNLFEKLSPSDIPYSNIEYGNNRLHISFPESATSVPPVFNELTNEVTGDIYIFQTQLNNIEGFKKLEYIWGNLWIDSNTYLHTVTGFDKIGEIGENLCMVNNPNLVALSIPYTIIKSVDYDNLGIAFEDKHEFKSPEEFVNSDVVIQDCINKFNPDLHGDIVVTQILENINIWGTPATQGVIINHLLSKRNYWSLIPDNMKHLAEDHYKHLYHSDFNNTGAKSVAKVATGVTYGLF